MNISQVYEEVNYIRHVILIIMIGLRSYMYLVYRLIGVDIELSELYQFYEKETQRTLPRNTRVILYIEIRNNQSYSRYQVFCHLFYEQNSV